MIAIRGAVTIKENSIIEIENNSIELFTKILEVNNIRIEDIRCLFFSCTDDITKAYPGKFIREHFNLNNTAIMHHNEMYVENSLKLCIRILVLVDNDENISPNYVYLNEAKSLRKDLFNN